MGHYHTPKQKSSKEKIEGFAWKVRQELSEEEEDFCDAFSIMACCGTGYDNKKVCNYDGCEYKCTCNGEVVDNPHGNCESSDHGHY